MAKHRRKHVVSLYRGRPVKPKAPRRSKRGRPPVYPSMDRKLTMVRSTEAERLLWDSAAEYESQLLGLPPGSELTVGPWLRRLANERAAEIAKLASKDTE